MEKKKKGAFRESLGFMFKMARRQKSKLFLHIGLIVFFMVFSGVMRLIIGPAVLALLERQVPLGKFLLYTGLLVLGQMGAQSFLTALNQLALFPRIDVRSEIIYLVSGKYSTTSYENVLRTPFIEAYKKASQHTSSNAEATEHIWTTLCEVLGAAIMLVIYLVVLARMPILLLLLVLGSSALSFYLTQKTEDWAFSQRDERKKILNRINYVNEVSIEIDYAKDIRLFGLKDWLLDVKSKALQLFYDFQGRIERRFLWMDALNLLLTVLRNAAAYAYLIHLVVEENLPAAVFLLYFTSFSNLSERTQFLLEKLSFMRKESDALREVIEFLDWEEPFNFDENAPRPEADANGQYTLSFENVSFRYPESDSNTLSDLNFTLEAGEKLAIVGLNGAGKTTLVRLLCGFLDPTEGRVLLNGRDIREFNREKYYELFSVVFQKFSLLAGSVEVNITQGQEPEQERLEAAIRDSGLDRVLERLEDGLQTLLVRSVYPDAVELSGGETQTLMLARALYHDAPLLVLDEPTAALDPIAESEMYGRYHELSANKSSVFISHRLASTRFCDRIFMMEDGRIKETGSHAELMRQGGLYKELFEVQSQYYQDHPVGEEAQDEARN